MILFWSQNIDIFIQGIWSYLLPFSVLFSFSNFIVASVKIWRKARSTKDEIRRSQEEIVARCRDLRTKVESVISVNDLANDLYQTN